MKYTLKNAKAVGESCRRFRIEELGMTQQQVAEEIGVTQGSVHQFETGKIVSWHILVFYLNRGWSI